MTFGEGRARNEVLDTAIWVIGGIVVARSSPLCMRGAGFCVARAFITKANLKFCTGIHTAITFAPGASTSETHLRWSRPHHTHISLCVCVFCSGSACHAPFPVSNILWACININETFCQQVSVWTNFYVCIQTRIVKAEMVKNLDIVMYIFKTLTLHHCDFVTFWWQFFSIFKFGIFYKFFLTKIYPFDTNPS